MHDFIEIRGARENNLKNVSLDVPRGKITVFTGVSGSGKSSIVFDTIGAEAQRQLNDTFTLFQQSRLPRYGQPDVDSVANLSTPIVISQQRIGGNARSTVGTITDIYALLRLLFSRIGKPQAGYSNAFSFNDPEGMCQDCAGLGTRRTLDHDKFFDREKSLNEGPFRHGAFNQNSWFLKVYTLSGRFDNDKPLRDYSKSEWQELLHGKGPKVKLGEGAAAVNTSYEGVEDKFERLYIKRDTAELAESTREGAEQFITSRRCDTCGGRRLNAKALASKVEGRNIAELTALEARELVTFLRGLRGDVAEGLAEKAVERLEQLVDIGLGYLSLDRQTSTLSGGESQRVKLVRHLNSSLVEAIYVLDEPSIGLHPSDVTRLNTILTRLRDKGNTVLVVEHDPDVIAIADRVVDVGPKAGVHGGKIVFEGSVAELARSGTLTGQAMAASFELNDAPRRGRGALSLRHVTRNNLNDVSVDVPKGVLTVVTGVAGSGKSSLVSGALLETHPDAVVIDQGAISVSSRSTPATYTGVMDAIRDAFAKANRANPSLFSFNSKGACQTCQGLGITYVDLAFLDPVKSVCETCRGKRFTDKVLSLKLRDKSIGDVLAMPVDQAREFFQEAAILPALTALAEVGLGYLTLGQSLSSLSGGERQRLKLATELGRSGQIYVLDEPTTGLHVSDVERLLGLFQRLVESQSTVVVIEHNLEVIARADWVIDLGPGAGSAGGKIVFEGTPTDLAKAERSVTGKFLASRAARVAGKRAALSM
jgi:excinuclease UvrABC ATPase subunit